MTGPASVSWVRFGRLERRGVLLGLSAGQLATVSGALVVLVTVEYTAGAAGVLISSPFWLGLGLLALMSVGGRPVGAWVPLGGHWAYRRAVRATTFLARPMKVGRPAELAVPGLGGLVVVETPGTRAGLIVDRRARTVTGVIEVTGRGFVLDDPDTQGRRVAGWGRVLAGLCQQPAIIRVQLLHRVLPGGGAGVRAWWSANGLDSADWAAKVVADLVADAEANTYRHETLLAVALRPPRGAGRMLPPADARTIERQLAAVSQALAAADLNVGGWADLVRLRQVIRASFDPTGAAHASPARELPVADLRDLGGGTPVVGPMGMVEQWDRVRTDSAWHAVYWIAEWPRSETHPGFLHPILLAPGVRRAFTIVAEPLPIGRALREIRRAKVGHVADAAQRARIGQVEQEATRAEVDDLTRREQDLAAGHGDLRFAGLLTVTAPTSEELDGACGATETAAAQAMCELRRLVGEQAAAHVAATLPLARGLLR